MIKLQQRPEVELKCAHNDFTKKYQVVRESDLVDV